MVDQAIILAAGEGQRLRPLTVNRPKVMLPIGNKPILQYVLEAVAANGIRRVVLVVGFKKEQVQDYFGSGASLGIEITYAEQKLQLGTAHAVKQAEALADESFLVIAGDNIIRPSSIAPLIKMPGHAMLVKTRGDVSKYGAVEIRDGLITSIVEKMGEGVSLVNTGAYKFTREIFSFIKTEVDLTSVISRMIEQGERVRACETGDEWLDAVYPWDMLALNAIVLSQCAPSSAGKIEPGVTIKGNVAIGLGSIIRSGCYLVGPAVIGNNCEIGPYVCLFPSTSLGDSVVVGSFATVRNSIAGNNVQIGPYSHVEDSVVAQGSRLGSHFTVYKGDAISVVEDEAHKVSFGAVIGELSSIGPNVVFKPGVLVGNRSSIEPLKVIRTSIPDGSQVL
ncbi:MAG: NTP transferase domain-containing protein [Chloroflexi bacterium]|nr:NTP transferase domain-containing protein [Chloroflexota bacterium]